MSKSLQQYLSEGMQPHEFRLKVACEVTDKQLDAMELHLRKYDGFDITTPKKTIIQRNPRDFRELDATEIFMIDFKTHQPASPHMLLAELTQKMGIHERFMVVRNKAEPLHVEDEDQEAPTEEYKPRLGDDEYSEVENPKATDYYGEEFKAKFIKEIAKERKDLAHERKES